MSRHFRIRDAIPVVVDGVSHTFFARRLGYLEYGEIRRMAVEKVTSGNKEEVGVAVITAVVLASVEEEDGTPAYTSEEWRLEIEPVYLAVRNGAMKAQGYDLEKLAKQAPSNAEEAELSGEEIEGNDVPSRMSGENSQSSSAALSTN